MKSLLCLLLLSLPLCARADTTLVLDPRPLPQDTLVIGTMRVVGTAVPANAVYLHGDMNFDGQVTVSDVILLIRKVLLGSPLPSGDPVSVQLTRMRGADTTLFTFVPKRTGKR